MTSYHTLTTGQDSWVYCLLCLWLAALSFLVYDIILNVLVDTWTSNESRQKKTNHKGIDEVVKAAVSKKKNPKVWEWLSRTAQIFKCLKGQTIECVTLQRSLEMQVLKQDSPLQKQTCPSFGSCCWRARKMFDLVPDTHGMFGQTWVMLTEGVKVENCRGSFCALRRVASTLKFLPIHYAVQNAVISV